MWYVYIIRSIAHPAQEYIDAAANLRQRLAEHNAGTSPHTSKYVPWKLVT
jgi:predicted GIY-YIG superfamily endonuclease